MPGGVAARRDIHEEGSLDAIHMTAAAVYCRDHRYAHRWGVESTPWLHPKLSSLEPSY
jgi:hypothetical protein